ncbi:MAG TPA: acetyl-CoA carboxylase biotin carboxylase subunit [Bacteroidota bacterium]|nr:acetyl-CoA carboxylase biotin carboxylase subunit [Bacteroidota bacterium]
MKKRIKKILIANRGEIAVRVIRTCKEMGIHTVAVHSEIDADLPHVRLADEAYCLGPAPARASYLNQEKILEFAKYSKSDAIHPGYGFLAENAGFANAVIRGGFVFIGPRPAEIASLGDKASARQVAMRAGVPVVPGSGGTIASYRKAVSAIKLIGYPVLLKASAGGGGKGMRMVRSPGELHAAFDSSRSEAKAAFGDDRVYVEKYIQSPRHVEVQILADSHGNFIHLGERECSIQRRHQKIIEESPCIALDDNGRNSLFEAALGIVRTTGYSNAGTLEFILDQDGKFYFLEMNTRLQVEHPVTEFRTGIDLVREQILIAQGEKLSFSQSDIDFRGYSIEARICAEDPANSFAPCTGHLKLIQHSSGYGIREETGFAIGNEISSFYDSLLAKLIVWGRTRQEALNRLSSALESYRIYGVKNNLQLCKWIVDHQDFRRGEFDTHFLQEQYSPDKLPGAPEQFLKLVSAGASYIHFSSNRQSGGKATQEVSASKWKLRSYEHYS